jgi:hypothetical protein
MIVKARISISDGYERIVPIVVPALDVVRALAHDLHARGVEWTGEAFGWSAEYHPEQPTPPLDSRLTFTPADFCIGESGIWFFSMMWANGSSHKGRDAPPEEYLDDRHLIREE